MGRQTRALNRACWGAALRKPLSSTEPRKAGAETPTPANGNTVTKMKGGGRDTKVAGNTATAPSRTSGTGTDALPPVGRPFIGPVLSQEERARAMAHAPKTQDGARVLCWDAGTHRGCPQQDCKNAHGSLGRMHLLDSAVQMEVLRRGGLKDEKRLEAPQAAQRIDTLRKGILKKAASDRAPTRKAGRDGNGVPPGPAPNATPVAPPVVIEELSTGPAAKASLPPTGARCGLGPTPAGARPLSPYDEARDVIDSPPSDHQDSSEERGRRGLEAAHSLPASDRQATLAVLNSRDGGDPKQDQKRAEAPTDPSRKGQDQAPSPADSWRNHLPPRLAERVTYSAGAVHD